MVVGCAQRDQEGRWPILRFLSPSWQAPSPGNPRLRMNPSPTVPGIGIGGIGGTCNENTPLFLSTMASASTSNIAVDAAAGSVEAEDARAPLLEDGRGSDRPRRSAGAYKNVSIVLLIIAIHGKTSPAVGRCLHTVVDGCASLLCYYVRRKDSQSTTREIPLYEDSWCLGVGRFHVEDCMCLGKTNSTHCLFRHTARTGRPAC